MKRRDLLKQFAAEGCVLLRHGSQHDVYINPRNGMKQPIPRHSEIDENLVRHIRRYLGLEKK